MIFLFKRLSLAMLLFGTIASAGGLDQLHAFVQGVQSFRADFSQTVVANAGKKPQQAQGAVAILRPGKFRWVYNKPYDQLIVGDGTKIWLYDRDLEQVTVKKLDQALGSSPAALLAGSNDIEKNYSLKEIAAKDGLDWLEAKPKAQDSTFEWVRMGFANQNIAAMELRDNFGQTTLIRFNKVERNPKLPPDHFKFTPPKGVDVIGD